MYAEITTIEEAFKRQKDHVDLSKIDLSSLPDRLSRGMLALLKLEVITESVNNDDPEQPEWEPDYNNKAQIKWFPWYIGGDSSGSGFRFYGAYYVWTLTNAGGGARLACKDKARAIHMNKYFNDLYKEVYLKLK